MEAATPTVLTIWRRAWLKFANVKPTAYIMLQHFARRTESSKIRDLISAKRGTLIHVEHKFDCLYSISYLLKSCIIGEEA